MGPSRRHLAHLSPPPVHLLPGWACPKGASPSANVGGTRKKLPMPQAGPGQATAGRPVLSRLLKWVQFFNRGPISFTNGGPRGARAHLLRACTLAGPYCPAPRPHVRPLSSPPAGAAYG